MNLTIDIGNTFAKIGKFENGKLTPPVETLEPAALDERVYYLNPDKVIICSVGGKVNKNSYSFIGQYETIILDHKTSLPFSLDYKTPETLGVDRIAAAAGAQIINPGGVSMIIDAGTCITYDLLDDKDVFHGGIISPGSALRFRAMNEFTGNLPLIEPENIGRAPSLVGKSTKEAMESGVINGINAEIESFIEGYKELFPDLKVIMCGGEAKFFESSLKASIFAIPELVLIGLNRILEYNV
jgi:type III pantothenate kinase